MESAQLDDLDFSPEEVRIAVARELKLPWDPDAWQRSSKVDGLISVSFDSIKGFDQPLDHDRLFRWQSVLEPRRIFRSNPGRLKEYRATPLAIVSGQVWDKVVHYDGPPAANVHVEMDSFFAWFSKTTPTPSGMISTTGISRAAIALLWFECIYPFQECNGRIGRAIVAMTFAQELGSDSFPISLSYQILQRRWEYQDALDQARNGDMDASKWVQWFAHTIERACSESIRLLEIRDRETATFWVAQSQSKLNARQRKVLQVLLDHGEAGLPGGLNAAVYRQVTGTSKPTATRDLSDLVDQGLLISTGLRKSLRYALRIDGCQDGLSTRP